MDRKTAVILNPNARSARAGSLMQTVRELAKDATVWTADAPDDSTLLARKAVAEGFAVVVAAGGDGTVNHVVNGIAGSRVALGILPLGTMNVFAGELGLPAGNLEECWELILHREPREIDLPSASGRHFVQVAGIGFDAQIVQATSWDFKRQFGPLSYVLNAAQIASKKPPRLLAGGHGPPREGSFVLVGNGQHYAGPFVLFKDARIDDGLLDVLIFKNLGYLDIVRYLQAVLFGTHAELDDVEYFQTEKLTVTSDDAVPVEVDGELIGNLPVEFGVRHAGLRVIGG